MKGFICSDLTSRDSLAGVFPVHRGILSGIMKSKTAKDSGVDSELSTAVAYMEQVRRESASTEKQQRKMRVVTHVQQLGAVLENWINGKRSYFKTMDTFRALSKASGLKWDDDKILKELGEAVFAKVVADFNLWIDSVQSIVLEWCKKTDEAEGLFNAVTPQTEREKLLEELSQAVGKKDYDKANALQEQIARLG
jgi:hypothetical protein